MENKTADNIRRNTHQGVDTFMDNAENAKEYGEAKLVNLKEKAKLMRKNIDTKISENPEKAVLIAAGVGVVVGAIITAAIMRKRN